MSYASQHEATGRLSADEDRLRELTPTDRTMRNRLALQEAEQRGMLAYLERMLRQRLAAHQAITWDLIEGYADCKARLAIVLDLRERTDL